MWDAFIINQNNITNKGSMTKALGLDNCINLKSDVQNTYCGVLDHNTTILP
jgi:hypothetical protein